VRTALALAAAAALGATPATVRAQDIGMPLGTVPPAAEVQDMTGAAVNLSQFVGRRPVLVEFWASWCEVCEALLPKMRTAHARWGDRVEFLVIGVGVNQTLRTMQRHIERHPMPFRFYFDPRGAAVRAFQAPATGYVAVLDAAGRTVYTGAGEDQDLEAALGRAVGTAGGGR
jgi:thiol-disulfide isomerase/thioredoxin